MFFTDTLYLSFSDSYYLQRKTKRREERKLLQWLFSQQTEELDIIESI